MSEETQSLSFSRSVKVSPSMVYQAFTNATSLREWLCDSAQADPHPGGRLYLWWKSGFYSAGEFTALEPGQKIAFTWRGRSEPDATQVEVILNEENGGTRLSLTHSGLGTGPEWENIREEVKKGWETGLENLASVLESGPDLRFVRRPMLGIMVSDFNADIAMSLGVPVEEGIRLDGVVEGMGAQAAGLHSGDVVVAMAGKPVNDWNSLAHALQSQHAGDAVEVVYYRGPERRTTTMTLSGRPIPEIPTTAEGLAEVVKNLYQQHDADLEQLFQDVTEEQASSKPAPGEWSAKEILAHLILTERSTGENISDILGGQERWSDDWAGNSHEWTQALVAVRPTVPELLDELKRCEAENVAFLARLPEKFLVRKGSYWRLAFNLVSPPTHVQTHFDQIRAALGSD